MFFEKVLSYIEVYVALNWKENIYLIVSPTSIQEVHVFRVHVMKEFYFLL